MKGDFSRGHQPDHRRGKEYCRVLMQQRRLLLDSDVNALSDALHERLRGATRDLGCPHGSPDWGYLITPGRLLALFDTLRGVEFNSSDAQVYRDYQLKYLDRYPSLFIGATNNTTVTVTLRAQISGDVVFWTRSDNATPITVNPGGVALNAPQSNTLQAVMVTLPNATDTLQIDLTAGQRIWIGMIEQLQDAGNSPQFSVTQGRYHLEGLVVENPTDGLYPGVSFPFGMPYMQMIDPPAQPVPPDFPGLQNNDRLVAYLEGWERHITAVEDPGLREPALGGQLDTTTRTQAVGQVKLVAVDAALNEQDILNAFANRASPTGTLTISQPPAPPSNDPCALPVAGGYTGQDNRLYRFEVHTGGPLAQTVIKWSRDNGAELFPVLQATASEVVVRADSPLRSGDLVEILSEAVDLADQAPGTIDAAGTAFTAPEKAVGRLARLQEAPGQSGADKRFTFTEPDDDTVVVTLVLDSFGDTNDPSFAVKLRRWHGLIEPDGAADPYTEEIEDGIEVSLTGTYAAGDWWQYEARVKPAQSSGLTNEPPHGPRRYFCPLVWLGFNGPANPIELLAWLDHRFSPLCELTADDIAFDDDKLDEDCDTVQEVIDKLLERSQGGCCDHVLEPSASDQTNDAARVMALLDQNQTADVVICLKPGVYRFESTVMVTDRKVTIHGCPRAVIVVADETAPPFQVGSSGRLVLESLTVFDPQPQGPPALVEVAGDAQGFEGKAVGLITAQISAGQDRAAVRINDADPVPIFDKQDPGDTFSQLNDLAVLTVDVRLDECVVVGGWVLLAPRIQTLAVHGCACYCVKGGLSVASTQNTDIAGTTFVTGVNLAALANWSPQQLLDQEEVLLDQLPQLPTGFAPNNAGIRSLVLQRGRVEGCTFVGDYGVVAIRVADLRFEANRYLVNIFGLYLSQAHSVTIHTEHITRLESSSDNSTAIAIFYEAWHVSLTGCVITDFQYGINLEDLDFEGPGDALPQARSVHIAGNHIEVTSIGIQASRTRDGVSYVAIKNNAIRSGALGLLLYGKLNINPHTSAEDGRVFCVSDNLVAAVIPIQTYYAAIRIRGNRLRMLKPPKTAIGIRSYQPYYGLVIENNFLENPSNIPNITAFFIDSGSGARVSDNTVQSAVSTKGIQATDHAGIEVVGNDFGISECSFEKTPGVRFHANRLAGQLQVVDTDSGVVTDNRLTDSGIKNLQGIGITNAAGKWQISNNRVDGTIGILPGFNSRRPGVSVIDDIIVAAATNMSIDVATNLSAGRRAMLERFADLAEIELPIPGDPGPEAMSIGLAAGTGSDAPVFDSPIVTRSLEDPNVSINLDDPQWEDRLEEASVSMIDAVFADRVSVAVPVDTGPEVLVDISSTSKIERPYHTQVVGNWATQIQVGSMIFCWDDTYPYSIVGSTVGGAGGGQPSGHRAARGVLPTKARGPQRGRRNHRGLVGATQPTAAPKFEYPINNPRPS